MAGMYRLLQRLGMEPVIVCDWNSQKDGFRISAPAATDWKSFEIIIYHHSLYWELGEELIHHSACPIVFKYHNITPARFFKPYSEHYYNLCAQGREQTKVFAADKRILDHLVRETLPYIVFASQGELSPQISIGKDFFY